MYTFQCATQNHAQPSHPPLLMVSKILVFGDPCEKSNYYEWQNPIIRTFMERARAAAPVPTSAPKPAFEQFPDDAKAVFSDAFELAPEHVFVEAPLPEVGAASPLTLTK